MVNLVVVVWAVVSQADPARDIDVIRNAYNLFNTAGRYTKMIIDATRPLDYAFPERFRVPPAAMDRVQPEEWVKDGKDLLGRLPRLREQVVR